MAMSTLSEHQQNNRIVFETGEPGYEHGVEQTVLSGPGLQLLNPGPRDLYQHRMHDVDGSVSELYQANARWRACDLTAAPTDDEQQELRSWFLESGRTYTTVEGDTSGIQVPLRQIPPPLGPALAALAEIGGESGVFYASDIVVVWRGHTWLLPASADCVVRMRTVTGDMLALLCGAIPASKREAFTDATAIVSVTTVPWRIEIMQGPRGYRVALQQSGLLLAATMQTLTRAGGGPTVATEFADVVVDDVLDQDGVERFSTALISVAAAAEAPHSDSIRPDDEEPK